MHLKSSIKLEVNQLIKILHCFIKLIEIIRVSSFKVAFTAFRVAFFVIIRVSSFKVAFISYALER